MTFHLFLKENMELMQQAGFECDLTAVKINVQSFTNYLQMLKSNLFTLSQNIYDGIKC